MRVAFLTCYALLVAVFIPLEVSGYNILMALLVESKSVHRLYQTIARHLVASNHSVTLLTSYNATYSHPNFVNLNVMGSEPALEGNAFEMTELDAAIKMMLDEIERVSQRMWKNEAVLELWKKRHTFDAVIMPSGAHGMALPFIFNTTGPLILTCNPGLEYFSIANDGNWLPPSVVPSLFLPYDENMNFFERCVNVLSLPILYFASISFHTAETTFLESLFPDVEYVARYYEKSALQLINGHYALDNPVPLLPNQVEIGTINSHTAQPLPKDLEDFIESSGDHGVIYFSLGSYVNSTFISHQKKLEFIEAFKRVPQKVIWKYEADDMDLPPNVLKKDWLPQQDILGHPKTRVYISHCGIQSTQEAKYHGVPVLAVPVAFDQPRNAARMVRKNIAVSLSWDTLTADQIVEALNILINDTSYSARMKQLSAVLQDQKESPGERAVWWIEYVIRHRGAPHLQYTGKQLHFLQYICADVIAFLVVCVYVAYRLIKIVIMFLLGSWFKKTEVPKVKKQ
ncbi:UDP-glucuronosyl/UDP-glucosyltransferase [Trinorchestia longiramus]|nr:UDP-glucuronosyl/UDP-glucosyltransferase [Trinorchestia longiramus]